MKKIIFNKFTEYLEFYNKHKEQITIYSLSFTKTMKIRLFYDIM